MKMYLIDPEKLKAFAKEFPGEAEAILSLAKEVDLDIAAMNWLLAHVESIGEVADGSIVVKVVKGMSFTQYLDEKLATPAEKRIR